MNRKNNNLISYFLLFLGIIFYFVANFQRIAIPGAIFDILEQELAVAAPYITAFGAIFMYIYAIGQLVVGVLVDRYGGHRVMLGGGILFGIGCLLFPLTSFLPIMYFSRALLGFGGSCFYLSLIRELRNIYSDKDFGLAISVMLFIGYTGGIAANAPFVFALKYMTWREIFIIIACVIIFAVIVFLLILPKVNLPKVNSDVKLQMLPFRIVLNKKHNRNLFSFACCNFGISYVIQTIIGKKFLEDFCVYSSQKAALILSVMAIVAAFFNIINASVCKLCHNHRVRYLKTASVVTFCCLLFTCLMILFNIKTILVPIVFCVLAGNASLTSLLVPVLHQTNTRMTSGTAVSIMNFCFFMMVGILGTLTGFILNIFEPTRVGDTLIFSNNSYLLLFGLFLALSMFEVYKAGKMSDKY